MSSAAKASGNAAQTPKTVSPLAHLSLSDLAVFIRLPPLRVLEKEKKLLTRWRRGWDSNPRYACAYSGFRDRHVQPLRHLSGRAHFTSALTRRLYDLEIPHVGLKNGWNIHTAVGALIVLHDRNQRTPDGEPRSVERVNELRLAFLVAEARLHASRLKRLEVRARRNLAVIVVAGKPHLDIVGLGRGEAGVTGAQRDHA